jgi:hypothetical protein
MLSLNSYFNDFVSRMGSLERSFAETVDDRVTREDFDSLLNNFVEEANAQYKIEWKHRKAVLAEKASRVIQEALKN